MKRMNNYELLRIKGISEQIAYLLEVAGVNSMLKLSQQNSGNLFKKLKEVNSERNLLNNLPKKNLIKYWVSQAKIKKTNS